MTENYQAQTKVAEIRLKRGWSRKQYDRFRDAVIEEGKELLLGDKYWQGSYVKPEPVLWRNLNSSVVEDILKSLKQELKADNVEREMPLDENILKWKLLPWLRDNQYRIASAGKSSESRRSEELPMTRESDPAAEHQSIETSASEELVEAAQPGMTQGAPCEKSHSREDARSTHQSRGSSFFDPIKDALRQ